MHVDRTIKLKKGKRYSRENSVSPLARRSSCQTLYRVNCRLFHVGHVRQRSGIIGPCSSPVGPFASSLASTVLYVHADNRVLQRCVYTVCASSSLCPIRRRDAVSAVTRAGPRCTVPSPLECLRTRSRPLFNNVPPTCCV